MFTKVNKTYLLNMVFQCSDVRDVGRLFILVRTTICGPLRILQTFLTSFISDAKFLLYKETKFE